MLNILVLLLAICVAAFLVGGIPFGYIAGRWLLKDDIRSHGSGNIGATNVGRVLGWKWGAGILVLDALKGLLPTLAGVQAGQVWAPESWHQHLPVAAGICAIVGHMYPVYLKLRGGKGVATALGVVIVLAPKAVGVALVVFLTTVVATRRVALGSMLAAVSFAAAWLIMNHDHAWTVESSSLSAFSVLIPMLIIWRHRSNIFGLLSGTELPVTESTDPRRFRQPDDSSLPEGRSDA